MKTRIDFPQPEGGRLRLDFGAPCALLVAHALDEVIDIIAAAEAAARAGRWAVGMVAYEAAAACDHALPTHPPDGPMPLAVFAVYDDPVAPPAPATIPRFDCDAWCMAMDGEDASAAVDALRRRIADGDFYQVNLTTRLATEFSGDGAALFAALRAAQPDAYCLHLATAAWEVLSVSPELFFDWRTDGTLTTRPMKGTAPRHADPATDAAAAALAASAKDRAENLMIVDLLRNDLGRVAAAGSVTVPELFAVAALPTAWQMSSAVRCTTRPDIGLADIFRALFPCGSITGAPKAAAMAAIRQVEPAARSASYGRTAMRPSTSASAP